MPSKISFHLWGHGGPQFAYEVELWEQEESDKRTLLSRKKKQANRSFAEVVRTRLSRVLTGANSVPLNRNPPLNRSVHRSRVSVFDRIHFPQASVFDRLLSEQSSIGDHDFQILKSQPNLQWQAHHP
jgi:hypothetical protein